MKFIPVIGPASKKPSKLAHKRTKAEQLLLVGQWKASQLKQTEFCQQHNLNVKTFSNWLAKMKRQPEKVPMPEQSSASMQKTSVLLPEVTAYELELPNGIRVIGISLANLPLVILELSQCKFN
jgi:hypothetical protein